jgi:predicted DCC family thiol-disulfide oxidoreductase YuxK
MNDWRRRPQKDTADPGRVFGEALTSPGRGQRRRALRHIIEDMTELERNAIQGRALLLYDGVCALCNGVVQFLMKHDRLDSFRYAPLESSLGREVLGHFDIHTFPEGVMLLTDALTPGERLYQRSDAVAAALQLLRGSPGTAGSGGFWRLAGRALGLVPRPLRDWGYGIVARFRYRIFGRYDTCPIPPPEQRSRLLGVYE